jgi:hypothetical protein
MIDIQDYLTHMAVGLTDRKTIEEAKWGKLKKKAKAVYDRHFVNYTLTEEDLP